MNLNPGDLVHLQISKSERRQEAGLKLEERPNGRIYIRKVTGLVKRSGLPVEVGDELKSLNETDVEDMTMAQMKGIIKNELKFAFSIRKYDPDDDDESEEEEDEAYQEQDQEDYHQPKEEENYPEEVRPGGRYILNGIKVKEYNGQEVEVIQPAQKKGKWEVEVLSSQAILAVREDKLVPIHQYERENEEEEPEEELESEEVEERMLSIEGYIIEPGDTMKLRGIKKKAKMNGTIVSVLKLNAPRKEWKVELPDGSKMSVPGCNLRHVQ